MPRLRVQGGLRRRGRAASSVCPLKKARRGGSRGCWTVELYMSPHHSSNSLLSFSLSLFSPTHSHHSCTADSREREVDVFYLNWSPQTVFLEQEEKTRPDNCHKFSPIFTCLFLSCNPLGCVTREGMKGRHRAVPQGHGGTQGCTCTPIPLLRRLESHVG